MRPNNTIYLHRPIAFDFALRYDIKLHFTRYLSNRIQTYNLQLRKLSFYSVELWREKLPWSSQMMEVNTKHYHFYRSYSHVLCKGTYYSDECKIPKFFTYTM